MCSSDLKFCNDAVDPILVGMKGIEAKLIGKDGKDQDGRGDSQGKADNVDSCIGPVAKQGTPGDLEIILYHSRLIMGVWIIYSERRLFTGLASAARMAWKPMVTSATPAARKPAIKKTHHWIEMR